LPSISSFSLPCISLILSSAHPHDGAKKKKRVKKLFDADKDKFCFFLSHAHPKTKSEETAMRNFVYMQFETFLNCEREQERKEEHREIETRENSIKSNCFV
jgi:hypothetical protein